MILVAKLTYIRAGVVATAQIVAGIVAAIVVKSIIPGDDVLFNVSLAKGVTEVQGFFFEMLFTFELVLAISMLAAEVSHAMWCRNSGVNHCIEY